NDLGLAVANSLAAVRAGARQVECTINGIGERAGNEALEEVVLALRARRDFFGNVRCGVKAEGLLSCSSLVSKLTRLAVQSNKAVVGENAFFDCPEADRERRLLNRAAYRICDPESVGWTDPLGSSERTGTLGTREDAGVV